MPLWTLIGQCTGFKLNRLAARSAAPQERLRDALHAAQRGGVEPAPAVARAVVAVVAPLPHLHDEPGQAGELELAVVGVARRRVAHPPQPDAAPPSGGEDLALDPRARCAARRAQPEPPAAA